MNGRFTFIALLAFALLSACILEDGNTPPAAPTQVQAEAADNQITIAWTASDNATSYNIYWSTAAGVDKNDSKISPASSPYPHTGLDNGTTCYYMVTAVNALGESDGSSEVSATPFVVETDGDGDGYTATQGDCDDEDPSISPGANEICGDAIDQDCDGSDLACAEPIVCLDDLQNWKADYQPINSDCFSCHTTCTPNNRHSFCTEGEEWNYGENICRACHNTTHLDFNRQWPAID